MSTEIYTPRHAVVLTTFCQGTFLMHARLPHPRALWHVSESFSPLANGWAPHGPVHGPLSTIARSKRPLESGAMRCEHTATPPADSPNMVMLVGSPPYDSMLLRVQRMACTI